MADIADTALLHRASMRDATASRASITALASVSADAWRMLADRAVEPNGYYLPDWELAVDASARGRSHASGCDDRRAHIIADGECRVSRSSAGLFGWAIR